MKNIFLNLSARVNTLCVFVGSKVVLSVSYSCCFYINNNLLLCLFPTCKVPLTFILSLPASLFIFPSLEIFSSLHSSLLSIHLKNCFLPNLLTFHLLLKFPGSKLSFSKYNSWKIIFSINFIECTPIVHHDLKEQKWGK